MTMAAKSRETESIVRRLRRPGSVSANSARRQERLDGAAASSRLLLAVAVRTGLLAAAPDR
jgi:hypothetical protein